MKKQLSSIRRLKNSWGALDFPQHPSNTHTHRPDLPCKAGTPPPPHVLFDCCHGPTYSRLSQTIPLILPVSTFYQYATPPVVMALLRLSQTILLIQPVATFYRCAIPLRAECRTNWALSLCRSNSMVSIGYNPCPERVFFLSQSSQRGGPPVISYF